MTDKTYIRPSMSAIKNILKNVLPPIILKGAKALRPKPPEKTSFANFGEEQVIQKYLQTLPLANKFCVDIAASDGITMSNTYALFKSGWKGIAAELDPQRFALLANYYKDFSDVQLVKSKVIPQNVVSLLKACFCPRDFAFLSFDIDSYDYFVLEQILTEFRPSLICTEINENVPPPISFTVVYDELHYWHQDHFYGQSISQCYELCKKFNYDIAELHYNNLFLIPHELNKKPALTPEQAYDAGYRNKSDRKEKMPWNADMEEVLTLSKEEAISFINQKFEQYKGLYEIG
jgi:hypothetical protein